MSTPILSPTSEHLNNTQRILELLIDGVTDYAIYMLDSDGYVHSWNSGAQRIKGYLPQEIIGKHFSNFYTEEERAKGTPALALATAAREGRYEAEGWRLRKDGSRFWASVVIDAIRSERGEISGFAKVTRDITERRAAQEELRRSEQHLRLLIQSVTDYAIYMLSPEGNVTSWNAGAERIKGYAKHEIIGMHFSQFYTPEDRKSGEPQRALRIAQEQGKYENEAWRMRRDGTRFWASVVITPIRDDAAKLIGFAKVTRDFTERQKAHEQLQQARARLFQSQKMEAVGKLTGGVAHDFNNVLQIIGGSLQLIQSAGGYGPAAKKWLNDALEAVERGSKLSAQLLAFARRQPLQPAAINPARLIRGMDALLRQALGEAIQIETVVAGGLWNTMVDPHQLENVILNVVINARDAMNANGKLTIELGNAMLDDQYALLEPDVSPGQYVLLAITDTGTGMPPDVVDRAFEPFFTTKPQGQGTGLGLSMAHGLIRQSGGHIKIYSEVGHGTTIKIYLPRSFEAEAVVPARASEPVAGGTETILVVEDDPKVQAVVVDMLTSLGYRVLRADNAQSALSIIKSGVDVDLLFTDVVMPGELSSTELAKLVKQYLPCIGVLFTSGYTQNAIVHAGRLDPGVQLLSKPYRREDLARKVRHVLSEAKQHPAPHVHAGKPVDWSAAPAMPQPSASGVNASCILVVEDNNDLRKMVCELLAILGYRTQSAGTAEEALSLLSDGGFHVLLTDISLPGVSGIELAKRAVECIPHLKVIFASGYGAPTEELGIGSIALRKPYDLQELRKALESV